jgi:3-hydroxypropanoate dehydrogenase
MSRTINADALDILFRKARTHRVWTDQPVGAELLEAIWDLAKMGPTSSNSCPARILFVVSPEAKERLKPCLSEGNVEKSMSAPAIAVIGHDLGFAKHLGRLNPSAAAGKWFDGDAALIEDTAFRNGALQGAYFMLATRALGLDCGPMSGFDNAMVDREFFAGEDVRSNFLCNIGFGDGSGLKPRLPRPDFAEACKIL